MEFKIKRNEFLNALSWTQSVVERKTTMPILSNVLLEVKPKAVQITATDLEVGVITQVNAEVIQEGKICVPAKSLYDIVKEIPLEEIKIRAKEQGRLEVSAGKSHFRIVGLPPEEFPNLPLPDEKQWYPLEAKGLQGMLDKTLHAISTDESRYNLHGVFLERVGEKALRMVATDGHRLSYVDREVSQPMKLTKGVIIPKKAVHELKRLVGESGAEGDVQEAVQLTIDGRNLIARRGGVTLVARLIDGDFPDYQRVIPKLQEKALMVDRQTLMGALRRVSLLISDRSRGIKFSLSSGLLELSTSNPDLGEAREEIGVDYKGDHLKIGFNARYFLDVLGSMDDEKVAVELNGEVGPCVLRSASDKGFLSVIMPMRI
ncbi:MAG: DNA polymerase III subunit beta [bacterium]